MLEAAIEEESTLENDGSIAMIPHKRRNLAAGRYERDEYGRYATSPAQLQEGVLACHGSW